MNKHDYETIDKAGLTKMTKALGITGAEVRKCKKCGYENTYLMTNNGEGFLFEEKPCKNS